MDLSILATPPLVLRVKMDPSTTFVNRRHKRLNRTILQTRLAVQTPPTLPPLVHPEMPPSAAAAAAPPNLYRVHHPLQHYRAISNSQTTFLSARPSQSAHLSAAGSWKSRSTAATSSISTKVNTTVPVATACHRHRLRHHTTGVQPPTTVDPLSSYEGP